MKALHTLIALAALVATAQPVASSPPIDPAALAASTATSASTNSLALNQGSGTDTTTLSTTDGRTYLLTTPLGGPVRRLVVALHWSTGTAAGIRQVSEFDYLAAAAGDVAVAYPQGINTSWNAGGCCRHNSSDDVAFLDAMISDIKAAHPDLQNIALFGQSNGGMMAYRYWFEGAHQITAFAVQAAAISDGGDFPPSLDVPYPAHLMHWHGLGDTIVPVVGRVSRDLSRAWKSPYCPLFATVSMAVEAADADLDRWVIRNDDGSTVTVWKGTHRIRLRLLPDSGHGGEGAPWPDDRHDFPWRWMMLRT